MAEKFLYYVMRNIKDDSGRSVIRNFDYTKDGFLVVIVNDARLNEHDQEFDNQGNIIGDDDDRYCTKLFPGSIRDFIKIKQTNMTYDGLRNLADWKNYFIRKGEIMPVPHNLLRRENE